MDDFEMQTSTPAREESARAPNGTPLQTGKMKYVYTIVDRGQERKHWVRIGTAWVNQDLSLNVNLDALPANNKLHIRDADRGYESRREGGAS